MAAYGKSEIAGLAIIGLYHPDPDAFWAFIALNADDQEVLDLASHMGTYFPTAGSALASGVLGVKESIQELQSANISAELSLVENENGVTRELNTKIMTGV